VSAASPHEETVTLDLGAAWCFTRGPFSRSCRLMNVHERLS
jgi:hypothetical protein